VGGGGEGGGGAGGVALPTPGERPHTAGERRAA